MIRRLLRASALAGPLAIPVVLFAAAAPASAGGFCHQAVTTGTVTEVRTSGVCFAPMVTHVPAGSTVMLTAGDDIDHTVAQPGGEPEQLSPGHDVTWSFPQEGVYPYFCLIHPGMVGVVVAEPQSAPAAPAAPASSVLDTPAPSALAAAVVPDAPSAPTGDSGSRGATAALAVLAIAGVAAAAGAIVLVGPRRSR
jgi:plastocyanin